MDTPSIILISAAVISALASLVIAYIPRGWGALVAYCGLLCLSFGPGLTVTTEALVFWGIAALIALGICSLPPIGYPGAARA